MSSSSKMLKQKKNRQHIHKIHARKSIPSAVNNNSESSEISHTKRKRTKKCKSKKSKSNKREAGSSDEDVAEEKDEIKENTCDENILEPGVIRLTSEDIPFLPTPPNNESDDDTNNIGMYDFKIHKDNFMKPVISGENLYTTSIEVFVNTNVNIHQIQLRCICKDPLYYCTIQKDDSHCCNICHEDLKKGQIILSCLSSYVYIYLYNISKL